MIKATFTQFRNKCGLYFDRVDKGETVQIYRKGKCAALLVKDDPRIKAKAYWTSAKPILDLGDDGASRMLIEERKKSLKVRFRSGSADARSWQIAEIRTGIEEAESGKFVDPAKVDAFFKNAYRAADVRTRNRPRRREAWGTAESAQYPNSRSCK